MSIADLIPWKRKKKTKIPVNVRKHPIRYTDRDTDRRTDEVSRWLGLAPFGVFGGWWDVLGPRMDLIETDEAFRVTVEVPGIDRENLDVTMSGHRLTVRGERRDEEVRHGWRSSVHRRSQQAFCRSIDLPCEIDANQVEASLSRGVLSVRLPKTDDSCTRKRIPVRRR